MIVMKENVTYCNLVGWVLPDNNREHQSPHAQWARVKTQQDVAFHTQDTPKVTPSPAVHSTGLLIEYWFIDNNKYNLDAAQVTGRKLRKWFMHDFFFEDEVFVELTVAITEVQGGFLPSYPP